MGRRRQAVVSESRKWPFCCAPSEAGLNRVPSAQAEVSALQH